MRGAGWSVGCVAIGAFTFAGSAAADDAAGVAPAPPPAASAPVGASAPTNQAEVVQTPTSDAAPATPRPSGGGARTVDRHGVTLLGGIGFGSDQRWPRVDVLMPMPLAQAPQLRVGVVLTFHHFKLDLPGIGAETYGLGLYPTATYDWRLPITSSAGDFVMGLDGSLGVGLGRFKIDVPFMPGTFESAWVAILRIAGRAEFRAHTGLVVSFQFLGIGVPLTEPDQPMQGTLTTDIAYELALLAGYQFP